MSNPTIIWIMSKRVPVECISDDRYVSSLVIQFPLIQVLPHWHHYQAPLSGISPQEQHMPTGGRQAECLKCFKKRPRTYVRLFREAEADMHRSKPQLSGHP